MWITNHFDGLLLFFLTLPLWRQVITWIILATGHAAEPRAELNENSVL